MNNYSVTSLEPSQTNRAFTAERSKNMLCKKCGGLVEPSYEPTGECENCFADVCGDITDVYKSVRPGTVSEDEALELPVSDLELNDRTTNRLSDKGIIFIKDLVKKTETELTNIPNFGDMSLNEVKKQLRIFGLALKQQ